MVRTTHALYFFFTRLSQLSGPAARGQQVAPEAQVMWFGRVRTYLLHCCA